VQIAIYETNDQCLIVFSVGNGPNRRPWSDSRSAQAMDPPILQGQVAPQDIPRILLFARRTGKGY
jgi:hypothetical protein